MSERKGRTFEEIKENVSRRLEEGQELHAKFLHDYRTECRETILPVLKDQLRKFGCPDSRVNTTASNMADKILNALCAKGLTEG